MALYDGLPLNTPTKVDGDGSTFETWATRTANGGTVETRLIGAAATTLANLVTLQTKAQQLLTTNTAFIGAAKPGTAATQASAAYDQCVTLSKGVDGIVRLLLGLLDSTAGT